jgi:hypothetical protein
MTDRNETNQQGKPEARDELELAPEEIADLELPAAAADDVRGGNCWANVKPNVVQTKQP